MSNLRLGAFFSAVAADWLSRMTGPLSLILLFTPVLAPKLTAQYFGGSTAERSSPPISNNAYLYWAFCLIQAVCALRFFYQNTMHRRIEIDRIPLPRYEKKPPVILSKAEVKALLEGPRNLKHRAMLATMYGAGLRVSEVTKLKVFDLDRERRVIWVRGGKGRKDRQVMLAEPLREVLAAYWRWKRPAEWLFPGKNADCPIATNSVFRVCAEAAQFAATTPKSGQDRRLSPIESPRR